MTEYADPDMRWARPKTFVWDKMWGRRARKHLTTGGAFGHHQTVAGGRDGQARCYYADSYRFKEAQT